MATVPAPLAEKSPITPDRPARQRGLLWVGLVGVVVLAGCGSGQSGEPAKAAKSAAKPVPVVVAEVQRKNVLLRAQGIGNVEAVASVGIKSRVDGQILKVDFKDGADVVRGQVLFEIDPRPAQAQLKQAQAKLASDMAALRHAEAQNTRYQDLLQKKFISPDGYEQYRANLDSARANVEADHAAIDSARLLVEYSTIRAPIAGRAGRIMVPQGNLVKANDTNPLVVINQLTPIYVNFALPEQYLPQVQAALKAGQAVVDIGGEGRQIEGTLAFVDNAVDVATGTIKLRASVPNKRADLWPGQFVNASVRLGEQADALVVPSQAVQTGPEGPFVFVIDAAGKAQMHKVRVDRVAGDETLIAEGLAGGEKVVVDGQSRLLPDSPVTIKTAAAGQR